MYASNEDRPVALQLNIFLFFFNLDFNYYSKIKSYDSFNQILTFFEKTTKRMRSWKFEEGKQNRTFFPSYRSYVKIVKNVLIMRKIFRIMTKNLLEVFLLPSLPFEITKKLSIIIAKYHWVFSSLSSFQKYPDFVFCIRSEYRTEKLCTSVLLT